jgi:hypothetical protein
MKLGVVTDMLFPVRIDCPSSNDRLGGSGTDWRLAPAWRRPRKVHAIWLFGRSATNFDAIVDFLLTKTAVW